MIKIKTVLNSFKNLNNIIKIYHFQIIFFFSDFYNICNRDKTTINFQYIYHIAFWLLENSTTLQAQNK